MKRIALNCILLASLAGCAATQANVSYKKPSSQGTSKQAAEQDAIDEANANAVLISIPRTELVLTTTGGGGPVGSVGIVKHAPAGLPSQSASQAQAAAPHMPLIPGPGNIATSANTTPQPSGSVAIFADGQEWQIQAIPVDSTTYMYMSAPSTITLETSLQISRFAGTHVVQTLSLSTKDNTKQVITDAGAIVAAVSPYLDYQFGGNSSPPNARGPTAIRGPIVIPIPNNLQSTAYPTSGETDLPGNPGWKYTLSIDAVKAPDVVSLANFEKQIANGADVHFFPVTACRSATVTLIDKGDQGTYAFTTLVGSPDFLELIPVPLQGKITAAGACGGDLAPEASGTSSSLDNITALLQTLGSLKNPPSGK